ncbi:MAG: thioredoxin-dependent thiol peroxidase [Bacteroidia bacterium]|nr:thioredoxin-dependent thiol peroxidase [Bacteroidia bacterium]
MEQLTEGMAAPHFGGITQEGKTISLGDFKGKKLILYFYPKDNTPGCTAESCNLSENYDYWLSKGVDVVGVSPDSSASHQKFIEKFALRFSLIADTGKKILQDYGVWGEKMNYGKSYMGVIRTTFLIDEKGIIEKIFRKVDTKDHTNQIIKELKF